MAKRIMTYKQYLDSDSWRCPKAPVNPDITLQVQHNTGAHHWREIQYTSDGCLHTGLYYCTFCFDVKKRANNWAEYNRLQMIVGRTNKTSLLDIKEDSHDQKD